MPPASTHSFWIEPRLRGLRMGSLEWFAAQKEILRTKLPIRRSYERWYFEQSKDLASVSGPGQVLELGSGAGFLKEVLSEAITSDFVPGAADRVIDARKLPFSDSSLRGILMSHVFHHIPEVESFFREAERVLVPGGVVSMVEVAHSPLSKVIFGSMHPEPYNPSAADWRFAQNGSPYDSNQALSWIVFVRDRERFEREFSRLRIESIRPLPWFNYLLCGGVMRRSLIPGFLMPLANLVDELSISFSRWLGLHWIITLRKVSD
jgi:SAM-dependent methyltransferase